MNEFQAKAANATYNQGAALGQVGGINSPRELGIIERVEGLKGGLSNINSAIESLIDRLDGAVVGVASNDKEQTFAPGINGSLSEVEHLIRLAIRRIDALSGRF